MTTISESGFTLKIATGQAIGITSESTLDPANMSSGSATAGQVATADGAGGISWSDESGLGDVTGPAGGVADNDVAVFSGTTGKVIKKPDGAVGFNGQDIANVGSVAGHVPTTRAINNGTGITGGGDLSADRTLAVDESALNPANMGSGAATSGQLLTAGGGGAVSWQDAPASGVAGPVSSTDDALTRWDGAGGDTLQNSTVTLSDVGAMVFPTGGSISKPDGSNSESFGSGSVASGINGVSVGNGASLTSADGVVVGHNAASGNSADDCVVIGAGAKANTPTSSNNTGAIAIGNDAVVNSTIGAGCISAICIGRGAVAQAGGQNSIGIGSFTILAGANQVVVGYSARCSTGQRAVAVGQAAWGYSENAVAVGALARAHTAGTGDNNGSIAIGYSATIGASAAAGCDAAIAIGDSASISAGHSNAVAIGAGASSSASNRVTFASALEVEIGQGLAVWGVTPPASQPAKINDPSGGTTVDSEARTAINSILDVLEGAGLSAAS